MTKGADVDWDGVEGDYRAGIKSLKAIGKQYGVSDAGILKRAKRDGWERDLSAKIRMRAEEKVSASVSKKVSSLTEKDEQEIVEANASMQADIILAHRTDIQRYRRLCSHLLDEIEVTSSNRELFIELGEFLRVEDDRGNDKRNDVYNKVISMSGRIDGMKKLAEVLKILIGLERQAFGISDNAEGDKPQQKQEVSPIEAARRIAFAMQLGLQAAGNKPMSGNP